MPAASRYPATASQSKFRDAGGVGRIWLTDLPVCSRGSNCVPDRGDFLMRVNAVRRQAARLTPIASNLDLRPLRVAGYRIPRNRHRPLCRNGGRPAPGDSGKEARILVGRYNRCVEAVQILMRKILVDRTCTSSVSPIGREKFATTHRACEKTPRFLHRLANRETIAISGGYLSGSSLLWWVSVVSGLSRQSSRSQSTRRPIFSGVNCCSVGRSGGLNAGMRSFSPSA